MFNDINSTMGRRSWIWQQDGAKAHTARNTVAWLSENTPEFITPTNWPAKSPDLNVMDYSIWSLLLSHLQTNRDAINTIEDLKIALTFAWDNISLDCLRKCTSSWVKRLHRCVELEGRHIEHY